MGREPVVVVHRDKKLLAEAIASRFVTTVVDSQASRGECHLVLTGGSMGIALLEAVATSRIRDVIDWTHLDLWWGDERFLPTGHPDRNDTQARAALLDSVPLDPARVHSVAGPDRALDVDDAARQYAAELARAAPPGHDLPQFDVVMLGVGPDAHVASLFPEHPALHETERPTIGVRGAPKPPPERVSMTFRALCSAQAVWFVVAGADKASAVALALSGAGPLQAPAGAVEGQRSTIWLLDHEAAQQVPQALIRFAGY
jgi:6-phosphogluconolactonase